MSRQPIVELIQPGERHLKIRSGRLVESPDISDRPYATIVDLNPIIFTGLVIRKQPVFLDVWNSGGYFTVVPLADATWIGSRLTVQVERIIRTTDALPIMEGSQLDFVVDFDGSAVVNGTRVETETPWLWPIEEGKRYLLAGDVRELGRRKEEQFLPYYMWLEPYIAGPLRGPVRRPQFVGAPNYETVPTFERESGLSNDIYSVADRLEQEISKRKRGLSQ